MLVILGWSGIVDFVIFILPFAAYCLLLVKKFTQIKWDYNGKIWSTHIFGLLASIFTNILFSFKFVFSQREDWSRNPLP